MRCRQAADFLSLTHNTLNLILGRHIIRRSNSRLIFGLNCPGHGDGGLETMSTVTAAILRGSSTHVVPGELLPRSLKTCIGQVREDRLLSFAITRSIAELRSLLRIEFVIVPRIGEPSRRRCACLLLAYLG